MATPYNPTQQPYQPPIQAAYPPPVAYGYPPPQDQSASSAPYPSPTVQGYPPQGYPPHDQTHDIPPPYPTLEQGPPPAYVYKPDQPAYGYQPQLANTTICDDSAHMSPPEENHFGIAICALVFSLFTLFTCGAYLISIPALILSIIALNSRGRSQKNKAGISIGLNVAVVVCTVVFLVVAITLVAV